MIYFLPLFFSLLLLSLELRNAFTMKTSRRAFIKTSAFLGLGLSMAPFEGFGKGRSGSPFLKKVGICTGLNNSGILISAGFSYLEEGVRNFLIPEKSDGDFEKKLILLKSAGIPVESCNSFLPGELKCLGPEIHHEAILRFAETAFRRASLSGIKVIVFGSGGSRAIPDGFSREKARSQFINLCRQMGPIAKKYDVTVCLEPLNKKECNFINSVSEGGEIVKDVNHKNIKLLADIYHMRMENEGPESIIKYGHLLRHVHIAEKEGRSAPGTHGEDFGPYFAALKKVNYTGRISIECRWENIETQAPTALQTLRNQIGKV